MLHKFPEDWSDLWNLDSMWSVISLSENHLGVWSKETSIFGLHLLSILWKLAHLNKLQVVLQVLALWLSSCWDTLFLAGWGNGGLIIWASAGPRLCGEQEILPGTLNFVLISSRRLQDTKNERKDFIHYLLKQSEHYDLSQDEVIVNAALFMYAPSLPHFIKHRS